MTGEHDKRDEQVDALVRLASERDTDEADLTRRVMQRLADQRRTPLPELPSFGPGLASLGAALLLLVAGVGGYQLPDALFTGQEGQILALATGDPSVVQGPLTGQMLGSGR